LLLLKQNLKKVFVNIKKKEKLFYFFVGFVVDVGYFIVLREEKYFIDYFDEANKIGNIKKRV
jgi:hypothetical protein